MIKHLQQLVKSFDHDNGLPGDAYEATLELINDILGEKSASVFRDAIKATDGGYYLSEGSGEAVWQAIYDVAELNNQVAPPTRLQRI